MNKIKESIKPIYRKFREHWFVSLMFRGKSILYERYVYQPLHRRKYAELKKFKDCHRGERCFIVATGPSLNLEDVNLLKGEFTMSMNSIYKLFDKTDWRPTYYGISDIGVFNRIKDDLYSYNFNTIFYPDRYYIESSQPNVYYVPIVNLWCGNARQRAFVSKDYSARTFGDDMSKHLFIGSSVVFFMIQIAFYMGFKKIYLLGTDCTNPSHHSSLLSKSSEKLANSPEDIYKGLMADYDCVKKEAEKRDVEIYNATRGGALEKFPRVNLEEVLGKNM